MFLFSRTTWDLIHTWAGVTLIAAAVIHLAIHWRWIVKVALGISKQISSRETLAQSQLIPTGEVENLKI